MGDQLHRVIKDYVATQIPSSETLVGEMFESTVFWLSVLLPPMCQHRSSHFATASVALSPSRIRICGCMPSTRALACHKRAISTTTRRSKLGDIHVVDTTRCSIAWECGRITYRIKWRSSDCLWQRLRTYSCAIKRHLNRALTRFGRTIKRRFLIL